MGLELELKLAEKHGLTVELAKTEDAKREAQALRYQVYCLERRWGMPQSEDKLDVDEFDDDAQHVVVRRIEDGTMVASARVVPGKSSDRAVGLPMQHYCCPSLFQYMDMDVVGEVSRFAISRQVRPSATSGDNHLLRLGLLRGVLRVSRDLGLTHWCALMEPSLLRLLRMTGVYFVPLGGLVECYGLRQPCIAKIDLTLALGRRDKPDFYKLVTGAPVPRMASQNAAARLLNSRAA